MSRELDFLGQLDPDDPKQASVQIANQLRAAILTGKLRPGDRLPSQPDLAARYEVARETVKRALEILRSERLIITRQGSGAFVRAQTQRAVELRPHIEAAFEQSHVSIDFAGFSGETLRDAIAEALDKVRAGRHTPESIAVRLLLSDMSSPGPLPADADGGDDGPVRQRAERITRRAADGIFDQVSELAELGLIKSSSVEIRLHQAAPLFKLYVINQSEVFYGFYPVVRRPVSIKGESTQIFDLMGKDVALFHYVVSDDETSDGSQFVASSRQWFESVWNTISYEYQP
ncbi:GntR family transcriptional regulator [Cryptosporangium phraense]|uniref:GntR family transcriptional regulator n=1 Tax=Cryptosporangium phraense TaxID=2593070 RepID=A0A545AQX2_9ACTN|nr:GntR family transcriptional regulator [Cryptosporangium phraense]TQS43729.1 GntR family transcriptional regulator [Cryptosporangium phraense]